MEVISVDKGESGGSKEGSKERHSLHSLPFLEPDMNVENEFH